MPFPDMLYSPLPFGIFGPLLARISRVCTGYVSDPGELRSLSFFLFSCCEAAHFVYWVGFDHGAGHPLLFLDDAKAPNCRNNNWLEDLGNYPEWPKVADAVNKALNSMESGRKPWGIPMVLRKR